MDVQYAGLPKISKIQERVLRINNKDIESTFSELLHFSFSFSFNIMLELRNESLFWQIQSNI